jgi:hypothetical protein
VLHVEIPVEVHRHHVADRAGVQQFLDPPRSRREAIVERHIHMASGAALGSEDACAFRRRRCHRLLGDDVDAGFQRLDDVIVMGAVAGADHQRIGAALCQHRAEVGEGRAIGPDRRTGTREAHRVLVTKSHELDQFPTGRQEIFPPGPGAAMACADHRHPSLVACRHGTRSSLGFEPAFLTLPVPAH